MAILQTFDPDGKTTRGRQRRQTVTATRVAAGLHDGDRAKRLSVLHRLGNEQVRVGL